MFRSKRHGLFHVRGHFGRKIRIPFKHLALQGTRAEQCLHFAIVHGDFAQEHRTETQAIHVHVGAVAHLRNLAAVGLRVGQFLAQKQIRQVTAGSTQRVRVLRIGLGGGLLQAQQAAVHAHGIVARHFAERLVDRKFHLRVQRIVSGFFGLRIFFGLARHVLARHHFFVDTAQVRRELGIAAIEFARFGLVFLGQLRFGVALFPVFRFHFFERVGLLQTDARERFDFALQRADFFKLQGILDAFLVFSNRLFLFRRPRPSKRRRCQEKQCKNQNQLVQFQSPLVSRL